MAKTYTATKAKLSWLTQTNVQVTGADGGEQVTKYLPFRLLINAQLFDADGNFIGDAPQQTVDLGAPRATEYTPAELGNIIKGSSNSTGTALFNALFNALSTAYTEAIGA